MANPKTPDEIKAADVAAKEADAAAQAAKEAQAEADELAAESSAAAFAATEAERAAAPLRTPDVGAQPETANRPLMLSDVVVHKPIVMPAEIKTTTAANGTITAHFGGDVPDDGK